MTPFIRGRILPEVEARARAKRTLDVLLWLECFSETDARVLDEIEVLKVYLRSEHPICEISLHVPECFPDTLRALRQANISASSVTVKSADEPIVNAFDQSASSDIKDVAATALSCDADVVVVNRTEWFPFVTDFDHLNMLLADGGLLRRHCELFVRGHDVPWSFDRMTWNLPWTGFYQIVETRLFKSGFQFLSHIADDSRVDRSAAETARTLIMNRLPNLCFTRDRLHFLDLQRAAAKRAKLKLQDFMFELGYYLNYYYLLLYGGFDHLAVVVNGVLRLGLRERQIGATYENFLAALSSKDPEIHSYFTDAKVTEFIKRIGALRHFAAHRGALVPGRIYRRPDVEPSKEDLDEEITRTGRDRLVVLLPPEAHEQARDAIRWIVRQERNELVADDILHLEIDGEQFFIRPLNDIDWNFDKFHAFMTKVLKACAARLQAS